MLYYYFVGCSFQNLPKKWLKLKILAFNLSIFAINVNEKHSLLKKCKGTKQNNLFIKFQDTPDIMCHIVTLPY